MQPGQISLGCCPSDFNRAMHTRCSSILVFILLIYALFAQTASLPSTVSFGNKTLIGLPSVNVSDTAASATDVAPIPVTSRKIVLAFLLKGQPIPEDEVKYTLIDADLAIAELARDHPTQGIVNDRFEYRRQNGNMLISIRANLGEQITWMELNRVLQGLYRYMTAGVGTEETHYQALEFEIEASGQEKPNIGYGVVWYFNPTKGEVQKGVTLPLPISSVSERTLRPLNLTFGQPSTKTLPRLLNTSLSSPGFSNMQETKIFPIPRTTLSLSFYSFGPSIPDQSVRATLQGASAKVRPYLNDKPEDPIDNDAFRYVLPLSREAGIPVAVTVFTYHNQKITWRQLFDVLFGLYAFTTTFGTDLKQTHYQVLGFRIVGPYSRILGVGTISYFTSRPDQLAKRVEATDKGILPQRPSASNTSSLDPVPASKSIVYPLDNTDIILTFTFLGDTPIRLPEIEDALNGARSSVVEHDHNESIPFRWAYISPSGRVSMNILTYLGKIITWEDLGHILNGILDFCQDDQLHHRVLVFEIYITATSWGRVRYGTLLYVQPSPRRVEKRALLANDTNLQLPTQNSISHPSLTALATFVPYPIPGTPITLTFNNFESPIPSIYVNVAFTSALRIIQNHVVHQADIPIPNDRWELRGAISRVWITVIAYHGNKITWLDLRLVLAAVLRFMTETGEHRCRELGFFIDKTGGIETGYGSVAYFPDGDVLVEKGQ